MARILALEPYFGGSHRAFLDGWRQHSRHEFTVLSLKPHHWKWRMRHSAITLAQMAAELPTLNFDLVWTSSMLNLAEFLGVAPRGLRGLPSVVYFHENQLAYPNQSDEPRDVHFAFTQWASAVSANEIWFNSRHNQSTFYDGLSALFQKMPDHRQTFAREPLLARSHCLPPGLQPTFFHLQRPTGEHPIRLCWAARFEHDKGPELLLETLRQVKASGITFRLVVMGEQFDTMPPALATLRTEFTGELDQFGFAPSHGDYASWLASSDLFVSTAQHEFFGLSVMEAAAAGCSLVLPARLSYPELFGADGAVTFYDNTPSDLARVLCELASRPRATLPNSANVARRFEWQRCGADLDAAIDRCLVC